MVPTTVDTRKDTATAGVRRRYTGHRRPGAPGRGPTSLGWARADIPWSTGRC